MTTLTVKIPDGKANDVSAFVKKVGGEIVVPKKVKEQDEDDEVTHEVFFGENIKRVIKAFKS